MRPPQSAAAPSADLDRDCVGEAYLTQSRPTCACQNEPSSATASAELARGSSSWGGASSTGGGTSKTGLPLTP